MTIFIPLLVLIIGLLVWGFATNAKLQEAGRIMFFCGLFVSLLRWPTSTVSLFGGS